MIENRSWVWDDFRFDLGQQMSLEILLYHFPKNYSLGISRRRDTQWWNVCSPADFRTRSNEKRTRHLGPALDPPSSHVRPIARDQRRTPLQHAVALGSGFSVLFAHWKPQNGWEANIKISWIQTSGKPIIQLSLWSSRSGVLRSKFRYGQGCQGKRKGWGVKAGLGSMKKSNHLFRLG